MFCILLLKSNEKFRYHIAGAAATLSSSLTSAEYNRQSTPLPTNHHSGSKANNIISIIRSGGLKICRQPDPMREDFVPLGDDDCTNSISYEISQHGEPVNSFVCPQQLDDMLVIVKQLRTERHNVLSHTNGIIGLDILQNEHSQSNSDSIADQYDNFNINDHLESSSSM